MNKLLTMMIGLGLVLGSVAVAQEKTDDTAKKSSKKKGGKKGSKKTETEKKS